LLAHLLATKSNIAAETVGENLRSTRIYGTFDTVENAVATGDRDLVTRNPSAGGHRSDERRRSEARRGEWPFDKQPVVAAGTNRSHTQCSLGETAADRSMGLRARPVWPSLLRLRQHVGCETDSRNQRCWPEVALRRKAGFCTRVVSVGRREVRLLALDCGVCGSRHPGMFREWRVAWRGHDPPAAGQLV
jgi:hypothetical protein